MSADASSRSAERRALLRRVGAPWRGVSLTTRILAVNVIVLALIAFSLLYIDSYRREVLGERFKRAGAEAEIAADALASTSPEARARVLTGIGARQGLRLRIYGRDGTLALDSFQLAPPTYTLADPAAQPLLLKAARYLDLAMDAVLLTAHVPDYVEPAAPSRAQDWPEVMQARGTGATVVRERYAPDRTPLILSLIHI